MQKIIKKMTLSVLVVSLMTACMSPKPYHEGQHPQKHHGHHKHHHKNHHKHAKNKYFIAGMTSPEIRDAIKAGKTTILIPTAGIEQNGQHLPLFKHRTVIEDNAPKIAEKLGGTLIAPTIDFVPEGDISPATGHMRYAGTISMPETVFMDIIAYTVKSLAVHGFKNFYIIGDSEGNQPGQIRVAEMLRKAGYNVHAIPEYYANKKQEEYLKQKGFSVAQIGSHCGLRDTSEVLAVRPDYIRKDKIKNVPESELDSHGSYGDITLATPEIGQKLSEIKIAEAVNAIHKIQSNGRK